MTRSRITLGLALSCLSALAAAENFVPGAVVQKEPNNEWILLTFRAKDGASVEAYCYFQECSPWRDNKGNKTAPLYKRDYLRKESKWASPEKLGPEMVLWHYDVKTLDYVLEIEQGKEPKNTTYKVVHKGRDYWAYPKWDTIAYTWDVIYHPNMAHTGSDPTIKHYFVVDHFNGVGAPGKGGATTAGGKGRGRKKPEVPVESVAQRNARIKDAVREYLKKTLGHDPTDAEINDFITKFVTECAPVGNDLPPNCKEKYKDLLAKVSAQDLFNYYCDVINVGAGSVAGTGNQSDSPMSQLKTAAGNSASASATRDDATAKALAGTSADGASSGAGVAGLALKCAAAKKDAAQNQPPDNSSKIMATDVQAMANSDINNMAIGDVTDKDAGKDKDKKWDANNVGGVKGAIWGSIVLGILAGPAGAALAGAIGAGAGYYLTKESNK